MLILGVVFLLAGFFITMSLLQEGELKSSLVSFFIFIAGIMLIVYDVSSPVERILKDEYISNKFSDVILSEPMKIREYEERPTRFLAIVNEGTYYEVEVIDD